VAEGRRRAATGDESGGRVTRAASASTERAGEAQEVDVQAGDQVDRRQGAGVTGEQAPPHGPLTSVASHRRHLNLAHEGVPFKASPTSTHVVSRGGDEV
jgi:hypothetical protein